TPRPSPKPAPTPGETQIPSRTEVNPNIVTENESITTGALALASIAVAVGAALVVKRRQRFDGSDEIELESI
ncbi:hypothetical protein GX563_03160, partial [Candidatus Bathyarchaeota archaeon]|nr:hypothetical protein [Candidatus Bathyarchaeota archaeon]